MGSNFTRFSRDCIFILVGCLFALLVQDSFSAPVQSEAQKAKEEKKRAEKEERKAAARIRASQYEACSLKCFEGCRK